MINSKPHSLSWSFPILLSLLVLFVGCGDTTPPDLDQNVHIQFKTTFDGSDFAFNEDLAIDDHRFQMTLLNFYISNLAFVKDDGTEVLFPDPHFIDLSSTLNPFDQFNLLIEPGNYESVRFAIGLDESTNATDAEILETENPLSSSRNMWWGWAKAYKFIVMEGRYDDQAIGTELWDQSFAYHMGNDELYREITLDFNRDIKSNELANLELNIDLKKVFFSGDTSIDLINESSSHVAISPFVIQLTDNFVRAFE